MKTKLLILSMTICTIANSQYTKLLDFAGITNGSHPYGSLISDGTFLYGMTSAGGANDSGSIFKIKPDGSGYTKLYDFAGNGNGSPYGSLVSDGTFLYGMSSGGPSGKGNIFKIKPDGTGYSTLYWFGNQVNGKSPQGSLISDGTFLYGMTPKGGGYAVGVLFKIKPNGTGFAKLLDFMLSTSGHTPSGSLIADGTFLYGMTTSGGSFMEGNVFKIKPDGTADTTLSDLFGKPYGSLISDGTFLYGMTSMGGTNSYGNIFKIKPDGTGYTTLYDFAGSSGGNPYGSLISDGTYFYGLTSFCNTNDSGSIFRIKPDGTGYSTLLFFSGNSNGSAPQGSLVLDGAFLYGMTRNGGANNMGVLFKFGIGTGVAEYKPEIKFEIYPNPFSSYTTLKADRILKNATLTTYNSFGKIVRQVDNVYGERIIFHRDNLPKGMYFVRITQENNILAADKLIIID